MKKLLSIAFAFSFFALQANAQATQNSNPRQRIQRDSIPKMRDGKMFKDLQLTPDQEARIKANRENMKQQREAVNNDASLTQDQKKVKMMELNKSRKTSMNSILTPEQKAKLQADRKNWNSRNKGKRGGGQMMNGLNLSEDQKSQIKANHDQLRQQRDAIKNDSSLTQDQKKVKMRELAKSYKDNMNSILSAEQKAKMEANRKDWKEKNKGKKWNGNKNVDSTQTSYRKSAGQ